MNMRILISATAAVLLYAGATTAEDADWKTVSLDDNPNFTVSLPKVVSSYLPAAELRNQLVMRFDVRMEETHMYCGLLRWRMVGGNYAGMPGASFDVMKAKFATAARNSICSSNEEKSSNPSLEYSESKTHQGFPAAECATSYTVAVEDLPGRVDHTLAIATPNALYSLACTVESASQEDAVGDWEVGWVDVIGHINESLHVPE
jgi:hypothetical protein